MHIGLIVGIGPAATDFYYRYLIAAAARIGRDLELTVAHADTPTLLRNQSTANDQAQVDIYLRLTERLHRPVESAVESRRSLEKDALQASPARRLATLEIKTQGVAGLRLRK